VLRQGEMCINKSWKLEYPVRCSPLLSLLAKALGDSLYVKDAVKNMKLHRLRSFDENVNTVRNYLEFSSIFKRYKEFVDTTKHSYSNYPPELKTHWWRLFHNYSAQLRHFRAKLVASILYKPSPLTRRKSI